MAKSSSRSTRNVLNAGIEAKVALAAPRKDKTLAELCQQFELRPNYPHQNGTLLVWSLLRWAAGIKNRLAEEQIIGLLKKA